MTTLTLPAASCSEPSSALLSGSSSPPPSGSNKPVPDELAHVREEIKRLEAREEELRALLLAHPDLRTGADWIAEIKTAHQKRTDLKELRAAYPAIVAEFTLSLPVTRVVLSGVTEDGEVVSARRAHRLMQED